MLNYEIPGGLKEERFGIRAFHHPELLAKLEETRPEVQLMEFIDHVCFPLGHQPYRGTAAQLLAELHRDERYGTQAKELVKKANLLGQYLSRLEAMPEARVTSALVKGYRTYTISPPPRGGGVEQNITFNEKNNIEEDGDVQAEPLVEVPKPVHPSTLERSKPPKPPELACV